MTLLVIPQISKFYNVIQNHKYFIQKIIHSIESQISTSKYSLMFLLCE